MTDRALPDVAHPDFAPFWSGCREARLLVPSCALGHLTWPPRPICQTCFEWNLSWTEVSGSGSLYSWTVVHRTRLAGYTGRTPYVVGMVSLNSAPSIRMLGRCDVAIDDLTVGLPLAVAFERVDAEVSLPYWRGATGAR